MASKPRPSRRSPGFGDYLRRLRVARKLSQSEVAIALKEALAVVGKPRGSAPTQGLIAQYEGGRIADPSPEILSALASVLGAAYIEMVAVLAKERYGLASGWPDDRDEDRWALMLSSLRQPEAVGRAEGPFGASMPGVTGFHREQLAAKAEIVARSVLLDVGSLARWEQLAPGIREFWIVAADFLADRDPRVRSAVVANLLKRPPISYEYFISPSNEGRFRHYLATLQKEIDATGGRRKPKAERLVRGYLLEPQALQWISTDYLAASGDGPESCVVFGYLRQGGELFAYQLDGPDAECFFVKWRNWKKDKHPLAVIG